MKYQIITDRSSRIASINGEVTFREQKEYHELLNDLFDETSDNYVMDLTDVSHIDSAGLGISMYPNFNLCLIQLMRRNFYEARPMLERLIRQCRERQLRAFEASVHFALMTVAAGIDDWDAWDVHFSRATFLYNETRVVDIDDAWVVHLAADLAAEARQPRRARLAYQLALRQWNGLNNLKKVGEVELALNSEDMW